MVKHPRKNFCVPCFGCRGQSYVSIDVSDLTGEDFIALKKWLEFKRAEVLKDCLSNPRKFLEG